MNLTIEDRAREIAAFLGKPYEECLAKLRRGFGPLHAEVTADWNRANPQTDDEILEWYRTTLSYVWELSAYHLDPGFNYMGMIAGISEALQAKGVKRVLCLGDGIGDLTLQLCMDGFAHPWYHDLYGSRTSNFAATRFKIHLGLRPGMALSRAWEPSVIGDTVYQCGPFDAIVSLDFLEHLPEGGVENWVKSIYAALKPGGWFVAQNGFAMGSGPDGAMPMHLACNDVFEKGWDPLLAEIGFVQDASNWYRRPM